MAHPKRYGALKVKCSHCERNTWITDPRFESTCRNCGNVLPPNPRTVERGRPLPVPEAPKLVAPPEPEVPDKAQAPLDLVIGEE